MNVVPYISVTFRSDETPISWCYLILAIVITLIPFLGILIPKLELYLIKSTSLLISAENDFNSICFCCTPKEYNSEWVPLTCYDGVILNHEIKQPASCSCGTKCAGNSDSDHQLERQSVATPA